MEQLLDVLRSPVISGLLMTLTWCLVSGSHDTVQMEIRAYRLQQFELQGTGYGSRSWRVLYEAVSLDKAALRRCVVVEWRKLVGRDLDKLMKLSVGALLIVIPSDLDALSSADRQIFGEWESQVLHRVQTDLAVYLCPDSEALQSVLDDVEVSSERSSSAVSQLFHSIAANTFQFSSTASVANHLITNPQLYNIVAKLSSTTRSSLTIALVAHYDSWAPVPAMAIGADSNASGVAALLEMLAVISRFYQNPSSRSSKYNFVFVLTAAGKFNYQGSRQWIDDYLEKHSDERLELVICLDSIGRGQSLNVHASKMPNETSPVGKFIARLRMASSSDRPVQIVSKKVNLGSDWLAWEHERFSMRRLPAVTLSHFDNHSESRSSMLDTHSRLDAQVVGMNTQAICEALLSHAFNLPLSDCVGDGGESCASMSLNETTSVQLARIEAWLKRLTSSSRCSAQPHLDLVTDLKAAFSHYTSQTNLESVQLADVALYGILEDTIVAHRVKPAVFELLLAAVVTVYLSVFYLMAFRIQSLVEMLLARLSAKTKLG